MAAPSIDRVFVNAAWTAASSASISFSDNFANEILIAVCAVETADPTTTPTINAPTATGLSFTQRFQSNDFFNAGGSRHCKIASFWAFSSAQLTNVLITVTTTANVEDGIFLIFSVTGCNTSSPFDPNASLPYIKFYSTAASSFTDTISTSFANDLIIGFATSGLTNSFVAPASFTNIGSSPFLNVGGTGAIELGAWSEGVTSVQSNLQITYTVSGGTQPSVSYIDALTADSGPPSSVSMATAQYPVWVETYWS